MFAEIRDRSVYMARDEKDKPAVDYPGRPHTSRAEYNSWRKDYYLMFRTQAEREKVLAKIIEIGDFDKACVYLDKF